MTPLVLLAMLVGEMPGAPLQTVVQQGHMHGTRVIAAVLLADGRRVLSGGTATVLWDVASGAEVRSFEVAAEALVFSVDGTRALVGAGNVLSSWDLSTGAKLRSVTLPGHINELALATDGAHLACATQDGGVTVVDAVTLAVESTTKVNAKGATGVAWAPRRNSLVSAGEDGTVRFFEPGREPRTVLTLDDHTNRVAFSADGRLLAVSSGPVPYLTGDTWVVSGDLDDVTHAPKLRILDAKTGRTLKVFNQVTHPISMVAFSPDGRLLVAAESFDPLSELSIDPVPAPVVRMFDVDKGVELAKLPTAAVSVTHLQFSEDGRYLLLGSTLRSDASGVSPAPNLELWDVRTRKLSRRLAGHANAVYSLDTNGSIVAVGGDVVRLWDLTTARPVRAIPAPSAAIDDGYQEEERVGKVRFTADGARVISVLKFGGGGREFEAATGKMLMKLTNGPNDEVKSAAIDARGLRVVTTGSHEFVRLYDVESGRLLREFAGLAQGMGMVVDADISPAGDLVAGVDREGNLKVWAADSGALKLSYQNTFPSCGEEPEHCTPLDERAYRPSADLVSARFSPDGKSLVVGSASNMLIWRVSDRAPRKVADKHAVKVAVFTADSKKIAAASSDGLARLFDASTGKVLRVFDAHTSRIAAVAVTPDGKNLITANSDSTVGVWNLATGELLVSLVSAGDSDYVAFTPDGYYLASRGALGGVRFTKGMDSYPFENFDLRLNRPDIVVQRLGRATPKTVSSYRRAWEKRLRRMGFTEEQLGPAGHLPEVNVDTSALPITTREKTIRVTMTARDAKHALDRINLYVNDVPVYGSKGLSVRSANAHAFTRAVDVELIPGRNKVQLSVHDETGAESLKETFELTYEGASPPPELYVLAIGVSTYHDAQFNLRYAAKDAHDVVTALRAVTGFAKVHDKVIADAAASKEAIVSARAFLAQARVGDSVVVFYAGHGLLDEKLDYYLATPDVAFASPAARGLPYDELEGLVDGIAARHKLLLVDACNSGEVDKETATVLDGVVASSAGGTVKSRGFARLGPPRAGADGSSALLGELFSDLRRGSGAVVVSSASGTEMAFESDAVQNGVFTYAMLDGLKTIAGDKNHDGKIEVSELRDYVTNKVLELTTGKQRPTARRESIDFDFVLTRGAPKAAPLPASVSASVSTKSTLKPRTFAEAMRALPGSASRTGVLTTTGAIAFATMDTVFAAPGHTFVSLLPETKISQTGPIAPDWVDRGTGITGFEESSDAAAIKDDTVVYGVGIGLGPRRLATYLAIVDAQAELAKATKSVLGGGNSGNPAQVVVSRASVERTVIDTWQRGADGEVYALVKAPGPELLAHVESELALRLLRPGHLAVAERDPTTCAGLRRSAKELLATDAGQIVDGADTLFWQTTAVDRHVIVEFELATVEDGSDARSSDSYGAVSSGIVIYDAEALLKAGVCRAAK